MVIGQIAGIGTAFGTGELSGAGFGPNYTILMKIGYEFYAPRIIEEMHKNPKMHFQDTVYWKQFQVSIKLYSDQVIKETLQTLLDLPDSVISAIDRKFSGGSTNTETSPLSTVTNILQQSNAIEPQVQDTQGNKAYSLRGVPMFLTPFIIPNPESELGRALQPYQRSQGPPLQQTILPPDTILSTKQTASGLSIDRITLSKWPFKQLNDAMASIQRGTSNYSHQTQLEIRRFWENKRSAMTQAPIIQRQKNITTFQKVTIPPSNIPPRSTKRPAGQSVKLERNRLIKEIARLGIIVKHRQNFIFKKLHDNEFRVRYRNGTINFIKQLRKEQQNLVFLLKNYTFSS